MREVIILMDDLPEDDEFVVSFRFDVEDEMVTEAVWLSEERRALAAREEDGRVSQIGNR